MREPFPQEAEILPVVRNIVQAGGDVRGVGPAPHPGGHLFCFDPVWKGGSGMNRAMLAIIHKRFSGCNFQ